MHKKHVVLMLAALLTVTFVDTARTQVRNSVYSMFGVGELLDKSIGVNRSLGGTGIAFQSGRSINYLNPASYLGVPPNSFIMELGAYGTFNRSENANVFQTDKRIDFGLWSASLYCTNWWALSLGVLPLSFVDYNVKSSELVGGELTSMEKTFLGYGGLSQAYLGNSFRVYGGLSAGFNVSYILGSISKTESATFSNSAFQYQLMNRREVTTFYLDYGLQYSMNYGGWVYTLGAVYGAGRRLGTTDSLLLSYDNATTPLEPGSQLAMGIPQKIGLGIAVKRNDFRAGFDYRWENWSKTSLSKSVFATQNSNRFSIGIEYAPGREGDWSKAVSFRFGSYFSNSYMQVENTRINSMGVSLGAGIPFDAITLNMSIEYGQEGTLSKGLVRNTYWVYYLSVSLHEFWSLFATEE